MANRYYICRRVGDGTNESPYNSELRMYVRSNFNITAKKQVISPYFPWVLMKYDLTAAQHSDVMANVPQVFAFPEGALDRTVGSIPATTRNAIATKMQNVGLNTAWITGTHTVRDVLKYIGRSIQLSEWGGVQISAGNFDLDSTVGDIPVAARQRIAGKLQGMGIDTSGVTLSTTIREVIRLVRYQSDGTTPRLFGTRRLKQLFYDDEELD